MANPITPFAIDSGGPYIVTAKTHCRRIEVRENYDLANLPQCDLQQFAPGTTTNPALVPKGTVAVFSRADFYTTGKEVGRINTASGSCTVVQIEYGN
jgi:hypothetical protein